VPVACALSLAGLAAQASRWERLAARAMAARTETGFGLRLSFRPEPGVAEELRMLAAAENECCAWADWMVQTSLAHIVLDVRSTGQGIPTLHSHSGRLRLVRPPWREV